MLTHSSRALPSRFQSFINRVSEALRAELTFKITNRNKSRKNAQRPSVGPPCGPLEKALFFLGSRRPPDVPTSLLLTSKKKKKEGRQQPSVDPACERSRQHPKNGRHGQRRRDTEPTTKRSGQHQQKQQEDSRNRQTTPNKQGRRMRIERETGKKTLANSNLL